MKAVTLESYFRLSSYAMVASGAAALVLVGGVGAALAFFFALLLLASWRLEKTRYQLSERSGLILVLCSIPLFYVDWKVQSLRGTSLGISGVSSVTHLILLLSSIKLLQVKADRDWLFLYLISFFEVLLAAGLSVSARFLAALFIYLFCALSTIICFEIRKASSKVVAAPETLLVFQDRRRLLFPKSALGQGSRTKLVPFAAMVLLILIILLSVPVFILAPRLGDTALARSLGGIVGMVGFSNHVTLGEFGRLLESDQVAMRVRVEREMGERAGPLLWRGVALDYFDGSSWKISNRGKEIVIAGERNLFQLGTTEALNRLTTQTFFLEGMETPVLFAASRAVALQGALPYIERDSEGNLEARPHLQERLTYKAYSDMAVPDSSVLRTDNGPYPRSLERYLELPAELNPAIGNLARKWSHDSGASNRYDAARAIQSHLRSDYGYTLQMSAGGPDPLSDFLFNVRKGHCEYFATAMAVMLRTMGIATRIVNGFHPGEYNDAADAYTVRQKDAHSWVEVYFPVSGSWVTFDPTPLSASEPGGRGNWFAATFRKYSEALELYWIQYVVTYDKQEQRSLATSGRRKFATLSAFVLAKAGAFNRLVLDLFKGRTAVESRRPETAQGATGWSRGRYVLLSSLLLVAVLFCAYFSRHWLAKSASGHRPQGASRIEFYDRLVTLLENRGIRRLPNQTPMEFANETGVPEVRDITGLYQRVRFGGEDLAPSDVAEVEKSLSTLEAATRFKAEREHV